MAIFAAIFLFAIGVPKAQALLQTNRVVLGDDSLSFAYSLERSLPEAYFSLPLAGGDLFEMAYLSFWLTLEKTTEDPTLALFLELSQDTDGDGRFVFGRDAASRVLVKRFHGREETRQKITLPLSRFSNLEPGKPILEFTWVIESKRPPSQGKILIEQLLFGSHYPEGETRSGIRMQNRLSSFKIDHQWVDRDVRIEEEEIPLSLTLTFVDPYLEEIRFETSRDEGTSWQPLQSFYDHDQGGTYATEWVPPLEAQRPQGILLRAVGVSVLGDQVQLAGPYRIHTR